MCLFQFLKSIKSQLIILKYFICQKKIIINKISHKNEKYKFIMTNEQFF